MKYSPRTIRDYSIAVISALGNRPWLIVFAILLTISSCRGKNNIINQRIIDLAGENKQEIIKIIDNYRNPSDSLKLRAAVFLIENMEGLATLDTTGLEVNAKYFDFIGNIDRTGLVFPRLTRGMDSMLANDGSVPARVVTNSVNELSIIKADFIIRNIDSAFYMWQTRPWARSLSFDEFCEYVLPYRCSETYSDQSRDFFLRRYRNLPDSIARLSNRMKVGEYILNDLQPWFKEDPNILTRYPFLVPTKFSDLLKGRVGACNDANSVRVAALRAMGIATAYDQIPNWGNSNQNHYWLKIIDPRHDTVKSKITNINKDVQTQHIISATSFNEPILPGTPSNIQIWYGRTVPKVYRLSFSRQKSSLAYIAGDHEIPRYFQNDRLMDVTNTYVETSDVNLHIKQELDDHKYAYLCVFDNQQWMPVAWSEIKQNECVFKDMGKNIIYLPAVYENGKIVPIDDPILLTEDSRINVIKPTGKKQAITLYSKYPLRSYVIKTAGYVVGARFQAANNPDYSDSVTVHKIDRLPYYQTEIPVNNKNKYRFFLFQFQGLNFMEVSEIEFYGLNNNGKESRLIGKQIGNAGYYPYQIQKAFDSIPYNFYRADTSQKTRYIGIDVGEGNSVVLTKIKYAPYTDDNAVKIGDAYELFYWENGWRSHAIQPAVKKAIHFNNVPENALLLLKNKSGGTQERIFLYKDKKQLFW